MSIYNGKPNFKHTFAFTVMIVLSDNNFFFKKNQLHNEPYHCSIGYIAKKHRKMGGETCEWTDNFTKTHSIWYKQQTYLFKCLELFTATGFVIFI